ncbi:unnamed protein product [Prorocentrum cordatum]|uniref:Integrase catalytic domain-containing protein n=1 Tax=Prorocentrum cordatum TaxID=2364126 RepID=A0ABN9WF71_9DINO|nr:unnamed protein product [Polarella glacialis]
MQRRFLWTFFGAAAAACRSRGRSGQGEGQRPHVAASRSPSDSNNSAAAGRSSSDSGLGAAHSKCGASDDLAGAPASSYNPAGKCSCCGAAGRTKRRCSCFGGKSHQRLRLLAPQRAPGTSVYLIPATPASAAAAAAGPAVAQTPATPPAAPPRSKCSCCGAPSRTARGCSCKGGKSHQRLREQLERLDQDIRGTAAALRWRRVASKLTNKGPEDWDCISVPSRTDTMLDDSELPEMDRKTPGPAAEDIFALNEINRADMEVCCPENSILGAAVQAQGGTVVRCGLFNGFDMASATGVRRAMHLLRRVRPRRLILGPPCTADCAPQNLNQKTKQQRDELTKKARRAWRIQRGCQSLYDEAKKLTDCHTDLEQPLNRRSWSRSPAIKQMRNEMRVSVAHGCAHGFRDVRSGLLMKKAWRICSTDPEFARKVGRRCSNRPGRADSHEHRPIEDGQVVAQTAFYPPATCRTWAKHILQKNGIAHYGMEIFAALDQITEDDAEMGAISDEKLSDSTATGVMRDNFRKQYVWLRTSHIMALNLDEGSGLTSVTYHGQTDERSGNISAAEVINAWESWNSHHRRPTLRRLDPEGRHCSQAVAKWTSDRGIELWIAPGEAHWLMGKVERQVQVFKRFLTKLATLDPECPVKELISWAVSAINSMDKVGNHSPLEHVMGVTGTPGSNNPFAIVDGGSGETQEQRRLLARNSFLE